MGSVDVFRDEDIDDAARLVGAGVPVELHSWVGGFHGYDTVAPTRRDHHRHGRARSSYLRRALRALSVPGLPGWQTRSADRHGPGLEERDDMEITRGPRTRRGA